MFHTGNPRTGAWFKTRFLDITQPSSFTVSDQKIIYSLLNSYAFNRMDALVLRTPRPIRSPVRETGRVTLFALLPG